MIVSKRHAMIKLLKARMWSQMPATVDLLEQNHKLKVVNT